MPTIRVATAAPAEAEAESFRDAITDLIPEIPELTDDEIVERLEEIIENAEQARIIAEREELDE